MQVYCISALEKNIDGINSRDQANEVLVHGVGDLKIVHYVFITVRSKETQFPQILSVR